MQRKADGLNRGSQKCYSYSNDGVDDTVPSAMIVVLIAFFASKITCVTVIKAVKNGIIIGSSDDFKILCGLFFLKCPSSQAIDGEH